MIIHTVQEGDTLSSIAQQYGVSAERIIIENELPNPDHLLVGQSIGIRVPEVIHTVEEGDTLISVAGQYDITVTQLMQRNPQLAVNQVLYPGQSLVISYADEEIIRTIAVNGYAYPFIDRVVLRKTLPFLTFLSIFTYGFTPEGELVPVDDEELIAAAQEFGVAPIMMLAPMNAQGTFDTGIAHALFANQEAQARLIDNIAANISAKGYRGLDIDFEFVLPEDRQGFLNFVTDVHTRLSAEGYLTLVALAPKTSGTQSGLLYEAHDYPSIGGVADLVLLMTYEWGFTYGPPMATAPVNMVRRVLTYGVSVIENDKILMGIPNYAYDWALPFVAGSTRAESMGNQEAIMRGVEHNVTILFDETAQCPFFYYTDDKGVQHVVWFDDVRSMSAKFGLIPEFDLRGAGVWQIMRYFPGMWMVVNSRFDIERI